MAKGITKALLGGKLMFPSEFVAAVEFGGRDVTLTIAAVALEDMRIKGAKKEKKPVLSFKETKKRLVLNKTNAGTIADLYGSKAEEWPGHKVTLYPTKTECGGDTVDCIRVRARVPGSATPPPPAAVLQDPEPREDEPTEPDAFDEPTPAAARPPADPNDLDALLAGASPNRQE